MLVLYTIEAPIPLPLFSLATEKAASGSHIELLREWCTVVISESSYAIGAIEPPCAISAVGV